MQGARAGLLGCKLAAGGILPRSSAWPAPFDQVLAGNTTELVLAPILIAENASPNASDVLIVMRGNGAAGDVTRYLEAPVTTSTPLVWPLASNVGFRENDMVLVANNGQSEDCLIQHVAALSGDTAVVLDGDSRYYTPAGPQRNGTAGTLLTTLGTDTWGHMTVLGALGSADSSGRFNEANIQFYMFGIDAHGNLHRYDLLELGPDGSHDLLIADGVVSMRALYGVADADGTLQGWVSPRDHSDYSLLSLSTSRRDLLPSIVAIRLAVIVRSPLQERETVSEDELRYFTGLHAPDGTALPEHVFNVNDPEGVDIDPEAGESGGPVTDDAAQHFRYRVVESTIPIRNAMLALNPVHSGP